MDLDKTTLFAGIKKRLAWLTQRQEVLAQNVANADSPGYRARDLKDFNFLRLVRQEARQVNMDTTRPEHLGGRRKRIRDFDEENIRKPYETAPAGNAVILEEQMMKLNETGVDHRLMTELYRKHLNLFKTAIGKGRS